MREGWKVLPRQFRIILSPSCFFLFQSPGVYHLPRYNQFYSSEVSANSDINHLPAAKILARFDLDRKIYSFKVPLSANTGAIDTLRYIKTPVSAHGKATTL